ncbi:MAG: ergothioneine biosynthesis protein EgtB [Verrucomicrobiota bacterium]|nr:ergothioneine biosynthesis protein EgtB [Verrucomicrobiota bacterium]
MKAPDTLVAEAPPRRDEVRPDKGGGRREHLIERYRRVRDFTARLCRNLQPEDYVVQSMPDVSPTKWHLAHTSWFFETFVVKVWMPRYRSEVPQYAYLFNSYYNAAGDMHRRDLRGLISRPTVPETYRFRESIDECVTKLLEEADEALLAEIEPILILGLHHEQQHQELLITDIKHVFAQNPLYPVFAEAAQNTSSHAAAPQHFVEFDEATVLIGHDGTGFSYDNEGPRHRALVPPFSLSNRLITNGEYLAFMEAGGYTRPEYWLSLGWTSINEQRWRAPLYWVERDGAWWNFTLSGFRPVDEAEPVTHVSYFEADAYANWDGARLPTEFEWERAASGLAIAGNFVDDERFHPAPAAANGDGSPSGHSDTNALQQLYGDVWEWTRSAYLPYPGYRAGPGALGEYNGKFMCNQMVLRGGSCATSRDHIRPTYRNFFQPEKRWQFTGIRLARDLS